ncbi:MAG: D-alanyl carrier protein [Bacillales bacterium]|jgi:D-alanine--poly(phosphoribitol) ligase subunit 2|nr:D-alanyl carrier protein [Bacillales bacterium]
MDEKIIDVLCEICDCEEPRENLDVHLFEEGLLDSFSTVQLLVALEELGYPVAISDFDRETWATPRMILEYVKNSTVTT